MSRAVITRTELLPMFQKVKAQRTTYRVRKNGDIEDKVQDNNKDDSNDEQVPMEGCLPRVPSSMLQQVLW